MEEKVKKIAYQTVCAIAIAYTAGSGFLTVSDYVRTHDIVILDVGQTDDAKALTGLLSRLLNLK